MADREDTPVVAKSPILAKIQEEQTQGHSTRRHLFVQLEGILERPLVTLFTSFHYEVILDDSDAEMLEAMLQTMDLSRGLVLLINSPGGDGLAAERIINVCRSYSGTGEYWALVPGKAKSAATMVCFGASKIIMSPTAELGAVDPQLTTVEDGVRKRFSAYNLVESYDDLFRRATEEKGNVDPYVQQLAHYDEREIRELREALELSKDIAIRSLMAGMMKEQSEAQIREKIELFLSPKETKNHGRPIYGPKAAECGLAVEVRPVDDPALRLAHELCFRSSLFVSQNAAKCIEARDQSFAAPLAMLGAAQA